MKLKNCLLASIVLVSTTITAALNQPPKIYTFAYAGGLSGLIQEPLYNGITITPFYEDSNKNLASLPSFKLQPKETHDVSIPYGSKNAYIELHSNNANQNGNTLKIKLPNTDPVPPAGYWTIIDCNRDKYMYPNTTRYEMKQILHDNDFNALIKGTPSTPGSPGTPGITAKCYGSPDHCEVAIPKNWPSNPKGVFDIQSCSLAKDNPTSTKAVKSKAVGHTILPKNK